METGPVVVCLADVEPESITWLWPGRVAAGKLTLIVGDPGLGKSWITLDIAARLSSGRMWPDQVPGGAPADVLLLSAEDGIADTIRPRLDALAADVIRVHHLAVLRVGQKEHAIQLTNIAALEQAISQTKAQLVIIDPVSAYLGSTDSHRDAEVRGLMAPLAHLADRTGVAVLGVMHLAKSSQQPAIYRPIGSIAFTAAARLVLAVAADPEQDHRRILAPLKQNICAAAPALAYTLAEGRLEWEADPVSDVDVDVLLSAPTQDRQERLEAGAWLRQALADGPVESTQLQTEAAETAGISTRTLFRAKERLKVDAFKQGYGKDGKWYWRLPSPKVAT
jgi:RecA-family ATPase